MEEEDKSNNSCVTKCSIHADKTLEYFCKECDTVCCEECLTLKHHQCSNVNNITDMIKDFQVDDCVRDISTSLNSLSRELEYCGNTIDSNRHAESNLQKNALERLQQQMIELRKSLDNSEKQTEEKINEIGSENRIILDNAARLHGKLQNKISSIRSDLAARDVSKTCCELFIAIEDLKARIKQEITSEIEDLKQKSKIKRYEYVPLSETTRTLDRLQAGNIQIKSSEQKKGFIYCFPLDVFGDADIHSIPDLIVINDTFLVGWDKTTRHIIAIDTINICVTSKLAGLFTTSITKINDNHLAVSLPYSNMIQFLNFSQAGMLSKGNEIIIRDETFTPYGLQYCNDMLITACHSDVRILDMKGNIIRTIASDTAGDDMFISAFCVAKSPDNETIYILDYFSFGDCPSAVTSMTLDGKVKAVYKDKDLVKPQALSVDRNGNVYVHCVGTMNIHILSADCIKVQVMNLPSLCFAFSMESSKVYIGQDNGIHKYITN